MAVVVAASLAAWLIAVFLAARQPRGTSGAASAGPREALLRCAFPWYARASLRCPAGSDGECEAVEGDAEPVTARGFHGDLVVAARWSHQISLSPSAIGQRNSAAPDRRVRAPEQTRSKHGNKTDT